MLVLNLRDGVLIVAGVPGVLGVVPDNNFESLNKDYEGLSRILILTH